MKVAYFVHDLNDPAVARRLAMLAMAGAEVTLLGFRRGDASRSPRTAQRVIDLGRTQNGRMLGRLAAVVLALCGRSRWEAALDGADLVLARNLECLALAAPARARRAAGAALAYEVLDIHRLMLGDGAAGRALRWVEAALMRRCDSLMVSSPAFIDRYFAVRHRHVPQPVLVENCVLASEAGDVASDCVPTGPPWRIGWFGVIRCARSLELLAGLALALPGLVEIDIRGRPQYDVLPDFDGIVAGTPGLSFHGLYDRRTDLQRIYGAVHFTWALDFYEAGGNSEWLLPNRLYEGGLHGPVTLAAADTETGRWLRRHGAGILLEGDIARALHDLFTQMDAAAYADARAAMRLIPHEALVYDERLCKNLMATLRTRGVAEDHRQKRARSQIA